MVYRNYNSDATEIIESTPFESKQENLFTFLSSKAKPTGGWGNEAVEVCFQSINKL